MTATLAQKPVQMIADSAKVATVVDGGLLIITPRQCQGFSQLRGSILSDKAGTVTVQQNVYPNLAPPPLAGTWQNVYTKVLVPGTVDQFVVDVILDYIQITYQDVATGVDANVEINANLWPISALESNRAAAAADVVKVQLGANGNYGQVTVHDAGGGGPDIIAAANLTRKALRIKNLGDRVVYIGFDNAVTAANGFPLQPQQDIPINFTTSDVYGMSEANDQTVSYLQELE